MANTVTSTQIEAVLHGSSFQDKKMGEKTTVVCCTLPNGFEITESSACVDPANYDHAIGVKICLDRIKNRVWQLEGYLLQSKLSAGGVNG